MKAILCPQCQKEIQWNNNPQRPFCSERCKLIDLGRWASEEYNIPTEEIPSETEFEKIQEPITSNKKWIN